MSRVPRRRRHDAVAPPSERSASPLPPSGGLAGYRLLRRIASGDRADVYLAAVEAGAAGDGGAAGGTEATDAAPVPSASGASQLVAVRVYPAHVPDESVAIEIEAMSADAEGSLPALFDVAGLDDGRCCLAVERIAGPSVARLLVERTLTAGEAVTILAPVTVAVAELAAQGFVHTRLSSADVLLDDAGRPRLVGLGALRRLPEPELAAERTALLREGHVALAGLIEEVAAVVRPAGALDAAVELVRGRLAARPFLRCEPELERRLFRVATPQPVAGVDVRRQELRVPARITAPVPLGVADDRRQGSAPEATARRLGGLRALIGLAQLPDGLVERVARAVEASPPPSLRSRIAAAARARVGALTVGGLVGGGALVLLLTLVPPATADPTGDSAGSAATASTAPAPKATATTVEPPSASAQVPAGDATVDDAAVAARALLERRAECFAMLDLTCLEEVLQRGSAMEAADRAAMLAARDGAPPPADGFDPSTTTVTVEMGDAVLVEVSRAEPGREPASLLVVRGEAGWRLREIFD